VTFKSPVNIRELFLSVLEDVFPEHYNMNVTKICSLLSNRFMESRWH